MIRPSVTTFLDQMLRDKTGNIRFEDITVKAGSSLIDNSLRNSQIKEKTGLLVVSLRKSGTDRFLYNLSPDETITEGTDIIVIGETNNINKLRQLANCN